MIVNNGFRCDFHPGIYMLHELKEVEDLWVLLFLSNPQGKWPSVQFSSVTQSCPTLCDPMSCGPQHARPPCPSQTPGVCSDSCPSSRWCHPAISSSVVPFSSCPQSFPASESFPMSQLFAWGGQSIGVSALASVFRSSEFPMLCVFSLSQCSLYLLVY